MATTLQGEMIFPEGTRTCRNRSGVKIPKGYAVEDDSATNGTDAGKLATGQNVRIRGVAMEDIADGMNGSICIRGRVRCVAGGAINAHARIAPDNGGKFVAAGSADVSVGTNCDPRTTADTEWFMGEIDCSNPPLLA